MVKLAFEDRGMLQCGRPSLVPIPFPVLSIISIVVFVLSLLLYYFMLCAVLWCRHSSFPRSDVLVLIDLWLSHSHSQFIMAVEEPTLDDFRAILANDAGVPQDLNPKSPWTPHAVELWTDLIGARVPDDVRRAVIKKVLSGENVYVEACMDTKDQFLEMFKELFGIDDVNTIVKGGIYIILKRFMSGTRPPVSFVLRRLPLTLSPCHPLSLVHCFQLPSSARW